MIILQPLQLHLNLYPILNRIDIPHFNPIHFTELLRNKHRILHLAKTGVIFLMLRNIIL
jgi:hypothetical protein